MAVSLVQEIKGFTVLPLLLPPTPVQEKTFKSKTYQYIYAKKHSVNSKDAEVVEVADRSLFTINLPINTTLATLRSFFGKIATGAIIEKFEFNDDVNNAFKIDLTKLTSEIEQDEENNSSTPLLPLGCGLITFVDKDALSLAFNSIKKLSKGSKLVKWEFEQEFGGINYFDTLYGQDFLSSSSLSEQVAEDMLYFNQKEEESLNELQEMKEIVDEDGFTLVVGSHRKTKNGVLGKFKGQQNYELLKLSGRMKKKEKQDFYRFQIREKKKQEMNELLNKFKEDQEKIKVMKERRRFKPY